MTQLAGSLRGELIRGYMPQKLKGKCMFGTTFPFIVMMSSMYLEAIDRGKSDSHKRLLIQLALCCAAQHAQLGTVGRQQSHLSHILPMPFEQACSQARWLLVNGSLHGQH